MTVRRLSKIGQEQYGNPRAFFTGRSPEYISRSKGWTFYGVVEDVHKLDSEAELLVAMLDEAGNDTYVIVNQFVNPEGRTVADVMDALNSGKVEAIYCVGALTVRIHNADKEDTFVNAGIASDILLTDGHIRLKGASRPLPEAAAADMDDDSDIEETLG
jgi:hypothetical protein